ncbi:hypothetical protein C8R45DRAFT_1074653 [Mycena sanguinolenta]|nr:hypothetical protein C8R45DRAFT_1074653 [Mycena sanguinolenta]
MCGLALFSSQHCHVGHHEDMCGRHVGHHLAAESENDHSLLWINGSEIDLSSKRIENSTGRPDDVSPLTPKISKANLGLIDRTVVSCRIANILIQKCPCGWLLDKEKKYRHLGNLATWATVGDKSILNLAQRHGHCEITSIVSRAVVNPPSTMTDSTSLAGNKLMRVGVVGLSTSGWASMALAPALQHPSLASKYCLTAVSTRSATSAAASAKTYSTETIVVKPFNGDTTLIASDPDVDLVMVSIRPPAHKEAALSVISAKKNLFLEWPAGLNLAETTEIAEAAKLQGVRTIVGLQGRYSPVVRKIKEYVNGGEIGQILSTSVVKND